MIRRHITALRLSFMFVDGATAALLFVWLSVVRFGPDFRTQWSVAVGLDAFVAAVAYGAGWVVTLYMLGLYRLRARWSARTELLDILRAALLLAVGVFTFLFLFKLPNVSRLFLVLLFGAQVILGLASRLAVRRLFEGLRARGYNTRFMLVVGAGPAARAFADRISRRRELGLVVVGHLVDGERDPDLGRPVLGRIQDIETVLHSGVIDEIAICLPATEAALVEPITRLCEEEGKIVRIPLETTGFTLPGARSEDFDGITVLSLVYGPDRAVALAAKQVADLVLAGVALVALSPFLAAISLAIAVTDGRPILFRQTRVGLHGRPFVVNKFRTMVPDAEARLADLEALNEIRGHAFKVTDDPRLTRLGRFLRATSLDELPQLWNVLLGQMSLVGPRPPLPREVATYNLWHRRRLSMKPGITGLWQVQARREQDFDRWVQLDLAYIDRWSILLDLKIMLRTIPAMLSGR